MTILSSDIKFYESERMTDFDDGGGRMTGIEIISGELNNVFPQIPRVSRVYGRSQGRKIYFLVRTSNTDVYSGSHIVLTDLPDDPTVSILMFPTFSHSDERADAQNHIESYVTRSSRMNSDLLGQQIAGQRSIILYQTTAASLPTVGDILVLADDVEGIEQYVRILEYSHQIMDFQSNIAQCLYFTRRVITIAIGDPLQHTFNGHDATCLQTDSNAKVYNTQVSDAATYYGGAFLADPITASDTELKVIDIYKQIVPTTRSESPVVDIQAGGDSVITMYSGNFEFEISQASETKEIQITISNRAYSYVSILSPLPTLGTVSVTYMALGIWYVLRDDGSGNLSGEGTAVVNEDTGSISITLTSQPDINTSIVIKWGTNVHYIDKAGTTLIVDSTLVVQLGAGGIIPESVTASWIGNAIGYAVTDNGNQQLTGNGSGSINYTTGYMYLDMNILPDTGENITIDYEYATQQQQIFTPTKDGSNFIEVYVTAPIEPGSLHVTWVVNHHELFPISQSTGFIFEYWAVDEINGGDASGSPSQAGFYEPGIESATIHLFDDGTGKIRGMSNSIVNYATGRIYMQPDQIFYAKGWLNIYGENIYFGNIYAERVTHSFLAAFIDATNFQVDYFLENPTGPTGQLVISSPTVKFNLTPNTAKQIVPGTLRFYVGTMKVTDQVGGGNLYNSSGNLIGNVNYENGEVSLTSFIGGINNDVVIISMIATLSPWYSSLFYFTTAGNPIQPGSFTISATTVDGRLIITNTDLNGEFTTHDEVSGKVDSKIGLARVEFGENVLDSSLTVDEKAEWWYDADNIEEGYIWRPTLIIPNTVRYSIVVYNVLPLEERLLGINSVRLPSDGRVPIFRRASILAIHEDKTHTFPSPLSSGQLVVLPDTDIFSIVLIDQVGSIVTTDKYTVDKEAGTVTMATPLDLTAYTEPLIGEYAIEDLTLATDVQINGTITCGSTITHDYSLNAIVSSAVVFGDLQARTEYFFSEETWQDVWENQRVGNPTTAAYNLTQYPIQTTNEGATEDRFSLIFQSSTTVNVVGENIGVILANVPITSDIAPINPATGVPYFTMLSAGWGSGWATGEFVRFNLKAAAAPIWLIRAVEGGGASYGSDKFRIAARGDTA